MKWEILIYILSYYYNPVGMWVTCSANGKTSHMMGNGDLLSLHKGQQNGTHQHRGRCTFSIQVRIGGWRVEYLLKHVIKVEDSLLLLKGTRYTTHAHNFNFNFRHPLKNSDSPLLLNFYYNGCNVFDLWKTKFKYNINPSQPFHHTVHKILQTLVPS